MATKNKKAAVKKAVTKNAPIKKVAAKKIVVKKIAPKKAIVKKAATKQVLSKKLPLKKVASKKTTTKKVPKKTTKVVVKNLTPIIASRHIIPEIDGQQMIDTFTYYNKNKKTNDIIFSSGREFDISLFTSLLSLSGIKKIRFRNAVNSSNEHTLVVTGADENGFDILLPIDNTNDSLQQKSLLTDPPPPTNGMGDMGDQCSDPKYKA